MSESAGNIRQQIGEILGRVRGLDENAKEARIDAEKSSERLWSELRTVKHDARNEQQILVGKIELLEAHERATGVTVDTLTRDTKKLMEELTVLRPAVTELVQQRRTRLAVQAAMLSGAIAIWAVAQPLWAWLVARVFGGSPPHP